MKKLSEYKNEDALDLLADIMEPVAYIFADKEFVKKAQENKLSAIKHVMKKHSKNILSIIARLEGVPVEEYKCTIFSLSLAIMNLFNDPELMDFFKSQGLKINNESSGSAMENTGEEHSMDSSVM